MTADGAVIVLVLYKDVLLRPNAKATLVAKLLPPYRRKERGPGAVLH